MAVCHLGLFLMTLTWVASTPGLEASSPGQGPLERALEHLQAERWEEARQELVRAVEQDPSNAEAYNLLGSVYDHLGRHARAVEAFQMAIQAAPGLPASYNNLGISYLRQGRTAEATEAFEEALNREPDNVTAHYNLGWLFLRTGDPERAIHHLERARALQPRDVAVQFHLAQAYSDAGRLGEALEILEDLARNAEASRVPEVQNLLGTILARLGRTREAIPHLQRAAELDGQEPDHHYKLALALQKEGEAGPALEAIRRAVTLAGDSTPAEYLLTLGALHLDRREVERAERAFHRAVDGAPDRRATGVLAALLYREAGYYQQALRQFQQARHWGPSPDLDFQLGLTHFLAGDAGRALALLEPLEAEKSFPKTAEYYRLLARIYRGSQNWTESLNVLERALETAPEDLSLYFDLGLTLVNLNALAAAEEFFRLLLARSGPSAPLHVGLAQALMLQDRYAEAREVLEQAVGIDSGNAEAHYLLGNCLNETDRPEEAVESYLRAISREPGRDDFRVSLGIALERTGRLREAKAGFEEALRLNPASAEAHYRLGRLLAQSGEEEGALNHLLRAAELAPDDPQNHYRLGQLYMRRGETEKARQAMERFQALRREASLKERKTNEALAAVPVKSPEDYLRFLARRP